MKRVNVLIWWVRVTAEDKKIEETMGVNFLIVFSCCYRMFSPEQHPRCFSEALENSKSLKWAFSLFSFDRYVRVIRCSTESIFSNTTDILVLLQKYNSLHQKIESSKPVHPAKVPEDCEINSIFSLSDRMSVGEKETRRVACGATSWRLCSHPS